MGFLDTISGVAAAINPAASVASLAGDAVSAYAAHREAAMNRDFQSNQADIQRGREDTAHQREVADLKAAGLNPILSGTGGSGLGAGGAPSGSMAPMPSDIGGRSIHSGVAAAVAKAQLDNINQSTDTSLSQASLNSILYNKEAWNADTAYWSSKSAEMEYYKNSVLKAPYDWAHGVMDWFKRPAPASSARSSVPWDPSNWLPQFQSK